MTMNVYKIRKWRLLLCGRKPAAEGIVFGKENFPEGVWTRVRRIDGIEEVPEGIRIRAGKSVYTAKFSDHISDTGNFVKVLENVIGTERACLLKAKIDAELEAKREKKVKKLMKKVGTEARAFIMLCLDKDAAGHGDCFVICDDDGKRLCEYQINNARYQESSCLARDEHAELNIEYLIEKAEARFCNWQAPEDYSVYVHNTGEGTIRCSGVLCDLDLMPGDIYGVKIID